MDFLIGFFMGGAAFLAVYWGLRIAHKLSPF